MNRFTVFWEMHKIMIICTILFIIIFSVVNIFNVFDFSDGIKNIAELISIILVFYNADKSRVNANNSKDSALKSKSNAEYVKQLKEKAVFQALNIEKTRRKEIDLHTTLSKDKENILSEINKSLIFLEGDIKDTEKKGFKTVLLSSQFQNNVQNLGAYIDYYSSILDEKIIIYYKSIDTLMKKFLAIDCADERDLQKWDKGDIFNLKDNLLKMKVYINNI